MEIPKLEHLSIAGDIYVEPVTTRIARRPAPCVYLIMGPTGAGKSSFVEALAGVSQTLSISKDQLAGYTQTVTAYRLVNVLHTQHDPPRPVYLIDTPGFSDSKIAEIEILNMVRKWAQDNDLRFSGRILYLTPITETRLPGSRRRTFAMLKRIVESHWSSIEISLIIVTTMWDTVHNQRTRNRAESNFTQLRDEISQGFVRYPRTDVIKFTKTRSSALLAIDHSFFLSSVFKDFDTSTSPHLYQDLHERIQGALQEKQMIESDLAQPEARTNPNFRAVLKRNWRENHKTLTNFIDQFANFGYLPPECVEAAQDLHKSITAANVCPNTKPRTLFGVWQLEPAICVDRLSDGTVQLRLSNDAADLFKDIGHSVFDASKHSVAKLLRRGE
ncbi:hypothetical protein BJ165DRAFT_1534101 [Panaeolus papilionaceus]|nr:hypothetical protein BJ165DRAFT_1534101 [Panaeolus papilionaceus]